MKNNSSSLNGPLDVLHKLEREMHRAFHHENYTHKLDHLFNFCITSNSIRDYIFQYLQLTKSEKQNYHKVWNQNLYIKASKDIANGSKHCDIKKIKIINNSVSSITQVLIDDNGVMVTVPLTAPDYTILIDKKEVNLYEFTKSVIGFWKVYLESIGIKYKPQDQKVFFGDKDSIES